MNHSSFAVPSPTPTPSPSVPKPKPSDLLASLREDELNQVSAALLNHQSMLVLGEPGAGKTTLGKRIRSQFEANGFTVAIADYSGSAKETLVDICEQFDIPIITDDEKPKPLTAQQLKEELLQNLPLGKRLLILDNAHRFPASLRYWLEDCLEEGSLLLLLAYAPPAKDIFLKLPRIEMKPLQNNEIRTLMYQEALAHGATLEAGKFAELQQRAGNNPALARRLVREEILGLGEVVEESEHYQYIDGTPFLIAGMTCLGIIRLVGLGLGDKALYIMGGVFMILAIVLRVILYRANKRSSRL